METTIPLNYDRVRAHTKPSANEKIDQTIQENIQRFSASDRDRIRERIDKLNREWDIERALEFTSGLNVLTGLVLAHTVNRKWLLLSAISSFFLVQHAVQGWCPPLPVFRSLGIRTKDEIERENQALARQL